MNREKQVGEIRQGLAFIESYISIGHSTNLTDPNIHAEEFVRGVLNILFEYKLINTNKTSANYPCIDLIDHNLGLGIQITSEKGVKKILKTLDCLESMTMHKSIRSLKIFTLKPKQKRYTIHKKCSGIKFDWKCDIIDFDDIMQEIVNVQDESKLENLHSYIIRSTKIFPEYSTSIPPLYLPKQNQKLSWLSFSARSTKMVGRKNELNALTEFLENDHNFLWWIISGPAGSGKSRLALELCDIYKEKGWDVGFLSRSADNFNWGKFRPLKNTLIIVDYVVGRTREISNIVLEVSRASHNFDKSTRILLLERDDHIWIKEFIREESISESAEVISNGYNRQYLKLSGLDQSELLEIAKDVVNSRNIFWDEKVESRFIDWMNRDEISCRPLYAMLFSEFPNIEKPIDLLRTVLKREEARRRKQIIGNDLVKLENLLFVSTLVGSITIADGGFDHLTDSEVKDLLPNLEILDFNEYYSISSSFDEIMSLPGLRPDLLGELYVLDCLDINGLTRLKYQKLLKFGYKIQPDDVIAFVIKCYHDFSEHPAFQMLFNLSLNTSENRLTKAKLVAHSSCFPSIVYDKFLQGEFQKLTSIADSHHEELEFIKWVALSEYNYACTMFFTNTYSPIIQILLGIDRSKCVEEAKQKFRSVISRATENIQIQNMAQLNLGILLESDSPAESLKMYTEVIESKYSSEETKACALNNRASIYHKRKNHELAIADREKVLAFENTSADRRFVASFGCGESYYSLGKHDKVAYYMTKIIETEDIEQADKICAHIVKAAISYFREEEKANAVEEFSIASDILVALILDKNLKDSLRKQINDSRPINWDEVNSILIEAKEEKENSAFNFLFRISQLLATNRKKNDRSIVIQELTDLINLAILNGKRMRVSYPKIN